ncbi:MAG: hypothetical protein MUO50_04045, partial [Longimicrobiales bacterium]|nr:hypothetical protein [Longimicrobiales bacterium]
MVVLLSLLGFCVPRPTGAQEGNEPSPNSTARLIAELSSVQPGTPFMVAVHFELDPGWHNYWENAGDSGLPTTIEWRLPEGFGAGNIQWPVPERIAAYPLVDYGYSHEVSLLVEVTPPAELDANAPVTLEAFVDWLICETLCLPAHAELSLEIPVSSGPPEADPRWASLFRDARARLPKVVEDWSVTAEFTDSGYRLTIEPSEIEPTTAGNPLPGAVYFYPSDPDVLDHAAPQRVAEVRGSLTLDLERSAYAAQPTPVLRGVLVAEEGGRWDSDAAVAGLAVEARVAGVPVSQGAEADALAGAVEGAGTSIPPEMPRGFTLTLALLFALFG